MLHALTVDVEEYFQVSLFEAHAPVASWDSFPRRAADCVRRLLALFDRKNARATFFVVGWLAERERLLLREIVCSGHEVASHGWAHREVHAFDRESFRADLRRARHAIEDAIGRPVRGYRAPSWSIVPRTAWALDVLVEEQFSWDSSVFPVRHDRYGWPGRPREAHVLELAAGPLVEVPPATARLLGVNVPVAGGGWLRHLPFGLVRAGLASLERERIPAVVYVHPWELDPSQPRLPVPLLARVRHYRNLERVEDRLASLLDAFHFASVGEVLAAHPPRRRLPIPRTAEAAAS